MQLGCFGFHRQIYPQEGDSKKKWKIEIFGKFDMPNLTQSSIKTYTSVLFNLHKHMEGNRNNIDWFYTECENILDYLKQNAKKSTRKSILSALYEITIKSDLIVMKA